MIRDILGGIDTGILAQVGLLAFVVAFLAIVVYAFSLKKKRRDEAKEIPLKDEEHELNIPSRN